jgi:Zn-dependent peptidase ImmA (M78 family)
LCAHQLGHHVLHPNHRTFYECNIDTVFPDLYEAEADRFANLLLAGVEMEMIG